MAEDICMHYLKNDAMHQNAGLLNIQIGVIRDINRQTYSF
jgi:hypothetical protein